MLRDVELLALLRQERSSRPSLGRTLDLYLALVAARAEVMPDVPTKWLERARRRLGARLPALDVTEVQLDWAAVGRLGREICRIVAEHGPEQAEPLGEIASCFETGGEPRPDAGCDPEISGFVLNQVFHPFLQAYAAAAMEALDCSQWCRRICPVCGGPPDVAALDGEVGQRRLVCACCDFEWTYQRVGCPFCGNEDPPTLGYLPVGEGAYRLDVCEWCRRYLKTVDHRQTWQQRPLVLERILTLGLDLAAAREGYSR